MCHSSSNKIRIRYIISTIKPTTITYIRVTTLGKNLVHSKFEITIVVTCDNKILVTRTKCNPSTNNYIIVNRSIKWTIIFFIYKRKSNNASIWSPGKTHYRNKTDWCTDICDFLNHKIKNSKTFNFFHIFFIQNSEM